MNLMVKKSVLGCTFLVLLMAHRKAKNPLAGLLMEGALLVDALQIQFSADCRAKYGPNDEAVAYYSPAVC